jgi:hypothetical protein
VLSKKIFALQKGADESEEADDKDEDGPEMAFGIFLHAFPELLYLCFCLGFTV